MEHESTTGITSSMLSNRGHHHTKQGEYGKALQCHRRALALHKKESSSSGTPQNEETASHYDNLGAAYQHSGRANANRAVSYYHKALTIRLNHHGGSEDHISIARSLDKIARAYSDLGDYDRALHFHHKAKHIQKKLLGRDHEDTARTFWHIGNVHYQRGEEEDALIYFNKALDVQKKVLDSEHADKIKTQQSIDLIVRGNTITK